MKITIFDPYLRKFTGDMERWWLNQGHEVKMSRYYDPSLVEWGDMIWFDTCDNNLHCATDPPKDNPDFAGYDMHDMDLTGKQVIVRPIDIEVWYGHQAAAIWDVVDDIIFIAPHIREVADLPQFRGLRQETNIHTIPCGVDLDRYRFAERGPGYDIAVVSEKWLSKGTDYILQLALKLKQIDFRYKIHWLGKRSDYNWEYAYFDEFVEKFELPIEFTNWLDGDNVVDEFLEGKNYILHASHKEAFCYAVAEAMAKGIKPVMHRFYGADDLWPGLTWLSLDEALDELTNDKYDSKSYRDYLIEHGYTLESMMTSINNIIRKDL